MKEPGAFQGFSRKTLKFLEQLQRNNSREWFQAHKSDYEDHVMEPARAFIAAMGNILRRDFPDIIAVPRVNRSIFRINRDTRFSADKTPYKTHLGIWIWEGLRPRMECSGFYFQLEPGRLMLGVGVYMFPRDLLETYRNAVVDPERGAELARVVKRIEAKAGYTLGGRHYKRTPSGYDPDHPLAPLLLHKGFYVGCESEPPPELFTSGFAAHCRKLYGPLDDLHRWLRDTIAGGGHIPQ